ncbi:MAG: DUF4214 domain-containing protein, partial [Acidimicrobiia bacterium]
GPCDEGTGDEGTGDEGTGDEGTGDEGTGDEGTGDEGTGDEGTGDDDSVEEDTTETQATPIEKALQKWVSAPQTAAENTPTGFLTRLYLGLFSRVGDQAGMAYWQNQNLTPQETVQGFLSSMEGRAALGELSTAELLTFLYNNVLARQADTAGYNYWLAAINQGNMSRQSVIAFFINSAELHNLLTK